jgi:hypothetical protein
MISTNADTKEWKCVECTFKRSLSILSQDFLGVSVFRSPDFYFYFCHYLRINNFFLDYSPVSDSLYIPLVSILTTSPYISQCVHFPVLNFVTYNFMYVFCLQLFPVFCRIHVYNSLIIRRRKSIIQQLWISLFGLSDQLRTCFFS